jgi:7-carboxy-7-deazaguanine synthase
MQQVGTGMLRLLEHYTSTQGEGPQVGVMSQFVRFAGCNLRCPLWPCDSQFAINPRLFEHEYINVTPEELTNRIRRMEGAAGARNIVFTGGEPFLQKKADLLQTMIELEGEGFTFEAFTNGTLPFLTEMLARGLQPVMDWKLPGSGEGAPSVIRLSNLKMMKEYYAGVIKFTIADRADYDAAIDIWRNYLSDGYLPVYAGPVWDKLKAEQLVGWIKQNRLPWILNVQVHNYVFGAHTRGT